MLRFSWVAAVAALSLQSFAAASPLQPTGRWEVQYSDRACTARRAYGDHVIAFQPSPLGLTTRYVVEGPGKATRAKQFRSVISFDGGLPPIVASSLIYPLAANGRRGLVTILSTADAEKVEKAERFNIWAGDKLAKQVDGLPNNPKAMSADIALGSLTALTRALQACMVDLRNQWGMVDGKLPDPVKVAVAHGKLTGLFTNDDYPVDAVVANQAGGTQALLMIDETGKVIDCVTAVSSGSAAIDAVVCQVFTGRAKFTPATDSRGKPMKSVTMAPEVRFVFAK